MMIAITAKEGARARGNGLKEARAAMATMTSIVTRTVITATMMDVAEGSARIPQAIAQKIPDPMMAACDVAHLRPRKKKHASKLSHQVNTNRLVFAGM